MFLRCSGLVCRIICLALLVASVVFFGLNRSARDTIHKIYDEHAPNFPHSLDPGGHADFPSQLLTFWRSFEEVLVSVRPQCSPIQYTQKHAEIKFNASDSERTAGDFIRIPDSELLELKTSHQQMVVNIPSLVAHLPYHRNTRGIVMTAGGRYLDILLVSVRMIRRSGSNLPIEVFLDTWQDYNHKTCTQMLKTLNAKCLILSEIWTTTPTMPTLKSYQYKIFALLFSSFEEILFQDADAFPAHNPDTLFHSNPFPTTGLITWPDFWSLSSSPLFYQIAQIPLPNLTTRASSESGIILLSKRIHAETLLLAAYYNYYGPEVYYPLLSQGAAGEGDKETFLHAAIVLGKPFYAVNSPVDVMGKWVNGTWSSAGMKQADFVQDYEVYSGSDGVLGGSVAAGTSTRTMTMTKVRPFFIHNNIVKLDPKRIFGDGFIRTIDAGGVRRLWGDREALIELFGRDVEKEVWEEMVICACAIDEGKCERAKSHFRNIDM